MRLKNLRNQLIKNNLQAIFITKHEDVFYFSSFSGDDTFLFITLDSAYIVTDFRYVEQVKKESSNYELLRVENKLWTTLNDIISKENISHIGIQERHMSFNTYKKYNLNLHNVTFVGIDDMLQRIRMKKTPDEISIIRDAVKVADDAFSHILNYIQIGMTENEVALELEYFMRKNNASGVSFDTIVASGIRSSMPHGMASNKQIAYGDTITLDYGAIYNHYCSDMTRTIFVGEPTKEMLEVYTTVKSAQLTAINMATPGSAICDIDKAARDVISNAGYGDYFGHAVGHGVGLEVHELPSVSSKSMDMLEPGMIITIEPGIYLPNIGGVRIEDMLLIKESSFEILTTSTKNVIVI